MARKDRVAPLVLRVFKVVPALRVPKVFKAPREIPALSALLAPRVQPALLELPVQPAHKGKQEPLAPRAPPVLTAWTELPEPQGQLVPRVLPVQPALRVSLESESSALTVPSVRRVPRVPLVRLVPKVPLESEPSALLVPPVRQVPRVRREPQEQASVSVVRLPQSATSPHLQHSPTLTTSKQMAICGSTTRLESGKTSARSKVRKVRLVPQVRLALRVKQELLELLVLKVLPDLKVRLVQRVQLVPKVKRVLREPPALKVLPGLKVRSDLRAQLVLPDRRVTLEPPVLLVRLARPVPLAPLVPRVLRVLLELQERKVLAVPWAPLVQLAPAVLLAKAFRLVRSCTSLARPLQMGSWCAMVAHSAVLPMLSFLGRLARHTELQLPQPSTSLTFKVTSFAVSTRTALELTKGGPSARLRLTTTRLTPMESRIQGIAIQPIFRMGTF